MTIPANPQLMSEKERSGKIICSIASPKTGEKIEWVLDGTSIATNSNVILLSSNNRNNEESD